MLFGEWDPRVLCTILATFPYVWNYQNRTFLKEKWTLKMVLTIYSPLNKINNESILTEVNE